MEIGTASHYALVARFFIDKAVHDYTIKGVNPKGTFFLKMGKKYNTLAENRLKGEN
jgi:hypothetical protein